MSITDALRDIRKAEKAARIGRQDAIQKLVSEGATRGEAVRKVYHPYMSDADYAALCQRDEEAFGKDDSDWQR